jgi:hypothetical protein
VSKARSRSLEVGPPISRQIVDEPGDLGGDHPGGGPGVGVQPVGAGFEDVGDGGGGGQRGAQFVGDVGDEPPRPGLHLAQLAHRAFQRGGGLVEPSRPSLLTVSEARSTHSAP